MVLRGTGAEKRSYDILKSYNIFLKFVKCFSTQTKFLQCLIKILLKFTQNDILQCLIKILLKFTQNDNYKCCPISKVSSMRT